jgi:exonuclease III
MLNSQYLHIPELNKKLSTTPDSFSILHLNIRSLSKNFKEFKSVTSLINHKFSIIALTETWVKPQNSHLFNLDGYHHEFALRPDKTGGGISIFLDEDLDYTIRNDLTSTDNITKSLWIEIDKVKLGTTKNILIGCIYRIPGQNPDLFNEKMSTLLSLISTENKLIYHTGDYNLDLIKSSTHSATNEFLNINYAHSLSPKINKPTRITSTTATLIDNLFSNHENDPNDFSVILPLDISDHMPIIYFKSITNPNAPTPPPQSLKGTTVQKI